MPRTPKDKGNQPKKPRAPRYRRPQTIEEKIRSMIGPGSGTHAEMKQAIRNTPSTGHWEGSSRRMIKEVNNWPGSWGMPENSPARNRLRQRIAADPDETYVYYPIGGNRPLIWDEDKRFTPEEYHKKYGGKG